MSAPSVAFDVWIWAALDPVLVVAAVVLGWRADQPGKIFIAAIAAFGIALLVGYAMTLVGLPELAPVSRNGPILMPVRAVGALVWAALAFAAHRVVRGPRIRPGTPE